MAFSSEDRDILFGFQYQSLYHVIGASDNADLDLLGGSVVRAALQEEKSIHWMKPWIVLQTLDLVI